MKEKTVETNTEKTIQLIGMDQLPECLLGTIKATDRRFPGQVWRTAIRQVRMRSHRLLKGWTSDVSFIQKNEQKPLEVFAHFLHRPSRRLILVSGVSRVLQHRDKSAELGIYMRFVCSLAR